MLQHVFQFIVTYYLSNFIKNDREYQRFHQVFEIPEVIEKLWSTSLFLGFSKKGTPGY